MRAAHVIGAKYIALGASCVSPHTSVMNFVHGYCAEKAVKSVMIPDRAGDCCCDLLGHLIKPAFS
jgi:hypothetical protein